MGLIDDFNEALVVVKYLGDAPKDDELLEVYALYQQATVGDCNTAKPGMLDFKAKAKWEAWNGKKGTSQDDAKKAYVDKAEALFLAYGFKVYFPNWGRRPPIWAKWLKSGEK